MNVRVANLPSPICQHPEHSCANDTGDLPVGTYKHICPACGHEWYFDINPWNVISNARLKERDRRAAEGHAETMEELTARITCPPELRQYLP